MHTKTRFLGRLKVAAFADVMHARIKSESEYKWKKISRFQNRNSFSLSLSLSEKKKERRNSLSLFSLSLSLYVWSFSLSSKEGAFCAHEQREREREGMICAKRFVSLFKKCFSLLLDFWKSDEFFIWTVGGWKKEKIFQNLLNCPTRPTHDCEWRSTEHFFIVDTRCAYY